MQRQAVRTALFLIPILLLFIPLASVPHAYLPDDTTLEFLSFLSYVLAGGVTIYATVFKRSRLALATLHTGLLSFTLNQLSTSDSQFSHEIAILTLLISALHFWLLVQTRSSLFSKMGLVHLLLLFVPYLVLSFSAQTPDIINAVVANLPTIGKEQFQFGSLYINKIGAWVALPVFILGLMLCVTRCNSDELALIGVHVTLLLAVTAKPFEQASVIYPLIAQLFLVISVSFHAYAMAFIDTLTGIPSRRALEYKLVSLGRNYSLAMMDIDHFKSFNDKYGHDTGDQVLRMVASRLTKVALGGAVYRYGGEEFTIVFNDKDEKSVFTALDDCRQMIADYRMSIRSANRPSRKKQGVKSRGRDNTRDTVQVTISIGVAQRKAGEKPHTVLSRADKALYKAKNTGRNKVVAAALKKQPSASLVKF